MERYSVQLELFGHRRTWKQKVIAGLIFAAVFFLLRFGWSVFAPTALEKERGLLSVALQSGLMSLVWGSLMGFMPWLRTSRDSKMVFDLFVGEDSISGEFRQPWMMKWRVNRRTVRRGKIRSIFQIKGRISGIGISERGEFAARMLGYVYVPASLPEYEELKRLAESWRAAE